MGGGIETLHQNAALLIYRQIEGPTNMAGTPSSQPSLGGKHQCGEYLYVVYALQ